MSTNVEEIFGNFKIKGASQMKMWNIIFINSLHAEVEKINNQYEQTLGTINTVEYTEELSVINYEDPNTLQFNVVKTISYLRTINKMMDRHLDMLFEERIKLENWPVTHPAISK